MTEAEARARLERMIAPDMDPVLTSADVDDLLTLAKRPDVDGLLPSDVEWTPTWSLDAAAAAAWEVKAGRAASGYRFSEDGQSFSREQIHTQCLNMAKLYRRGSTSVRLYADIIQELVARPVPLLGDN